MEVKVTDIKSCEKSLDIEVPYAEIEEEEKNIYQEYKKEAKIEGFRKGKAPLSLVKQMYGGTIEQALIERLVQKYYSETLQKENISPISEARIQNVQFNKEKGLRFIAIIETAPVFVLADVAGIKIKKEKVNIDDKQVDEEIEKLRYHFGTKEKIEEPAEIGHFILADIQQVDPVTKIPLIGKKHNDQYFRLGDNALGENTDEKLIGIKTSENTIITREIPQGLVTKQNPENATEHFLVEIKNIENIILPEVDDEFVKDVNDKFKTTEDLKKAVRNQLEVRAKLDSEQKVRQQIEQEVIKHHEFDVPESMVENYIKNLIEEFKKSNVENLDEEYLRTSYNAAAVNTIKWYWIKSKMLEEYNITVEEQDIDNRIKEIAERNNLKEDQIQTLMRSKHSRDKVKEDLMDEKLYASLMEKVNIEEV